MTNQLFESNKLTSGQLQDDINNNIPSSIAVKDMIYGLVLSSGSLETHIAIKMIQIQMCIGKEQEDVYHEGDTTGMNCRFYNVFNFWMNTEKRLYCDTEQKCNTDEYGTCDDNSRRRGWHQIETSLITECNNDGTRTYTLTNTIDLDNNFQPIILRDGDIFDGSNISITYTDGTDANGWNGLFKLVESDYKSTIVIKNVNLNIKGNINAGKGGIINESNNNIKYAIQLIN